MLGSDWIFCGLFLGGIVLSITADCRLRRLDAAPWTNGCLTLAGVSLMLFACAAALR